MIVENAEVRFRGLLPRVAFIDGEGYQFLEHPMDAAESVRQQSHADIFTFVQSVPARGPIYDCLPMEMENFAVLPVSTYDNWITRQIGFKVRNKVRKAEKSGVVTREVPLDDTLIAGISAIYNESGVRQGRRFTHFGKSIEDLWKMKSTFAERSIFIGAFLDARLVGFVKLVLDDTFEPTQAGLMHILSLVGERDKAPTNALIAASVKACADRGIPNLVYSSMTYGKKGVDSLAAFKLANGFEKVDVPRFYVPLTLVG